MPDMQCDTITLMGWIGHRVAAAFPVVEVNQQVLAGFKFGALARRQAQAQQRDIGCRQCIAVHLGRKTFAGFRVEAAKGARLNTDIAGGGAAAQQYLLRGAEFAAHGHAIEGSNISIEQGARTIATATFAAGIR